MEKGIFEKIKGVVGKLAMETGTSGLGFALVSKIFGEKGRELIVKKVQERESKEAGRERLIRDIFRMEKSRKKSFKSAAKSYWDRQRKAKNAKDGSEDRLNMLLCTVKPPSGPGNETKEDEPKAKTTDTKTNAQTPPPPESGSRTKKDFDDPNQESRLEILAWGLNKDDEGFDDLLSALEKDWVIQMINAFAKDVGAMLDRFWAWLVPYLKKGDGALAEAALNIREFREALEEKGGNPFKNVHGHFAVVAKKFREMHERKHSPDRKIGQRS